MKKYWAVLLLGFIACNYDTGECWLRSEEGEGAGANGPIIPTSGAGSGYGHAPDYGDVPLSPQNASGTPDLCFQPVACTVTWNAASPACQEQGTAGTCTSRYQGSHVTLDEAEEQCEKLYGTDGGESCGSCEWVTGDADPAFGKPATRYIDCRKRGLSAFACAEVCNAAGAYCLPHVLHPKKSGQGAGELVWCKNGSPTYVCNYNFSNGDACAGTFTPIGTYWLCAYPGGKK